MAERRSSLKSIFIVLIHESDFRSDNRTESLYSFSAQIIAEISQRFCDLLTTVMS